MLRITLWQTLAILAVLALLKRRTLAVDTTSQAPNAVHQEEGAPQPDGLVGKCPIAVFKPISRCFCRELFTGGIDITFDDGFRQQCAALFGSEKAVLDGKGFENLWCIPFQDAQGQLDQRFLVKRFNALLNSCDRNNQLAFELI